MSQAESKVEAFVCPERPELKCYRLDYVYGGGSREAQRDYHSTIVLSDDPSAVARYGYKCGSDVRGVTLIGREHQRPLISTFLGATSPPSQIVVMDIILLRELCTQKACAYASEIQQTLLGLKLKMAYVAKHIPVEQTSFEFKVDTSKLFLDLPDKSPFTQKLYVVKFTAKSGWDTHTALIVSDSMETICACWAEWLASTDQRTSKLSWSKSSGLREWYIALEESYEFKWPCDSLSITTASGQPKMYLKQHVLAELKAKHDQEIALKTIEREYQAKMAEHKKLFKQ